MLPNPNTQFLPFSQLEGYEAKGYFCCAIVFSPETENNHFTGCPPYINMSSLDGKEDVFFNVPKSIAYYGDQHAGYTMAGRKRAEERGKSAFKKDLKDLIFGK